MKISVIVPFYKNMLKKPSIRLSKRYGIWYRSDRIA